MADPLKIAAIAYDNFWLEFMRPSLLFAVLSNYHRPQPIVVKTQQKAIVTCLVTMPELSSLLHQHYAI
jgi:hypothetical protein